MNKVSPPLIHLDAETGLHYIKGTSYVLFENGVRVGRSDFDNRIQNGKTAKDIVSDASSISSECDWDYEAALKTRNLVKKVGVKETTRMPRKSPPVRHEGRKEVIPESPVRQEEQTVPPAATPRVVTAQEKVRGFLKMPHADIVIIMVVVAALCLTMSIYHTYNFLVSAGKSVPVSFIAAFAMALYSSSAFTAARHVYQDKGIGFITRVLFSVFLVATGTFVIVFSVFSTTNVSYDQYEQRRKEGIAEAVQTNTVVVERNEQLEEKEAEIAEVDREIAIYERDSERFYAVMSKELPVVPVTENDQERIAAEKRLAAVNAERYTARRDYNRVQSLLVTARQTRKDLIKQKEKIREDRIVSTEAAKDARKDAYDLVAGRIGVSRDTLSFVVYVIPAAFFDVVAPFAFAIVLLLKDRMQGKETKKAGAVVAAVRAAVWRMFSRIMGVKDVVTSR